MSDLREVVITESKTLRSFEHTVTTPWFGDVLKTAKPDEEKELRQLYTARDIRGFRKLAKSIYRSELCDKPMIELRQIGRELFITNWCRMSKPELVEAIRRRQHEEG